MEELGSGDKIKLITQPAQSPDLNVICAVILDSLATFKQSTTKKCPQNVQENPVCIDEQASLEENPDSKLNRIWITLQSVMNKIIEDDDVATITRSLTLIRTVWS